MKKQAAIEYIRNQVGFVPTMMIFELYEDDDDIDQNLINYLVNSVKPKPVVFYCGSKLASELNKLNIL
jgi:hypothetical protein